MMAPHRARVIGSRHMAVAGHYLAAQAAFQILEAGGNAIDAGVAGGIALGVVQSDYVSFGGVAPILIQLADGHVISISGVGPWPQAARLDVLQNEYGGQIPTGVLRTVVPAAPDAWITALERYGTVSYGEAAAAALRFARDGFATSTLMSEIIAGSEAGYRTWPSNAALFLPNGAPPRPGDLFVQAELAAVIQYMIDEEKAAAARGGRAAGLEAVRRAFYRGDIAQKIVRHQAENGGWLTADDLAEFRVDVETAEAFGFDDVEIFTGGPWCQGPIFGQMLAMLEGTDLRALGHNSPAYVHHLVEVMKLAFADRHHYFGDPKFVDVPMARLFGRDHIRRQRMRIDPERAFPGMPPAGSLDGAAPPGSTPFPTGTADERQQIDTSYVCVADRQGNVFSATPSDASAAGPVVPGLGFVVSTRGAQSWTDPSVPSVVAPGKRPRLTPSPVIARRPGQWIMPMGSPGNDVQLQAMLQAFLNMVVWGMSPQEAVEQPRFATFSYPRSSEPHSYDPGLVKLESRIATSVFEDLLGRGHRAESWPDWSWQCGAVCTLVANKTTGMMEGGADPRRPTGIAGW